MPEVLNPTIPPDIGGRAQRQRIVDAMVDSCAEKTYAATTIADIVRRAAISRTTFYKWFPNKRACFEAALDSCIEELRVAAAESGLGAVSPADAVRRAMAATLGLMAARPGLARLVMGDAVQLDPAVVRRYRVLAIPALERLWDDGEPQRRYSDPRLAFGRAQVLIFGQIAAGRTEQLLELLPELLYTALLPFAGHEEAARQAQMTGDAGRGRNGSTPTW